MLIVSLLCIVCYRLRKVLRGEGISFEGSTAEVILPTELGGYETFIDRVREGAEGIGCVRVDVVERLVAECAGSTGRGGGVKLEGIQTGGVAGGLAHRDGGLGTACMKDAGTEEVARVVNGLPLVGGAGDALDGVPGGSEVVCPRREVAVVGRAVVREDAGGAAGPHGIVDAEDL